MREKPPLNERAQGKWPGILSALGVPAALLNVRKHHPCPFCGGKDRFRFTDHEGTGKFYCNQCGSIGGADFVIKYFGWDFARAAKEIENVLGDASFAPPRRKDDDSGSRAAMQKLWTSCSLIAKGDFVDRYLIGRGVGQDEYGRYLRKAESIKHETEDGAKSWHPAMVAKIIAADGKPVNLHRTYLTMDGQKAPVEPVRKTMWGTIPPGSAVRLFDAGPVMGIAEGIETALAASDLFRIPVWAAINSTIMAGWQPPEGTHQVFIFGDNDPKLGGQAAAHALGHKLACKSLTVEIKIPLTSGHDWNDVLIEQRGGRLTA
jgi:putative DNA primase/helicase